MSDAPVALIGSERFLTASQAARRLGVSRQRVHQLLRRGALTSVRVSRVHYVREADVLARAESRGA